MHRHYRELYEKKENLVQKTVDLQEKLNDAVSMKAKLTEELRSLQRETAKLR